MTIRLCAASAVAGFILTLLPAFGQSAPSSSQAHAPHSQVRLLSGGSLEGQRLAGLEIVLDDGFKTYWRTPGDSGLPPRFDWSGSVNVAGVEVKWPAPVRAEDAGGVAYAYHDKVLLPLLVKRQDPGKPAKLALAVDYGICKDICIPAHAEVSVALDGKGAQTEELKEALAALPRPQPLSAAGDLSVLAVTPVAADRPAFSVSVRAPAGSTPSLFAEGPEDWFLSTTPPGPDGKFTVAVEDRPKGAGGPIPVRLTLVAGGTSVETDVTLNIGKPSR
jgi:DsbC/DsbD-like thiol-disulfide interchange protein